MADEATTEKAKATTEPPAKQSGSGLVEPRESQSPEHRDAGQEYVDRELERQERELDEPARQ